MAARLLDEDIQDVRKLLSNGVGRVDTAVVLAVMTRDLKLIRSIIVCQVSIGLWVVVDVELKNVRNQNDYALA